MPNQRLVRPVFDDSPVVYDNDAIDAMDGGETVGNDDRRSPFCEIVQRFTNLSAVGCTIETNQPLLVDRTSHCA